MLKNVHSYFNVKHFEGFAGINGKVDIGYKTIFSTARKDAENNRQPTL